MINAAGVALIKKWEGCKLEAYPDPKTGGAPWTIGYGHTRNVLPRMKWTQVQANAVLMADIEEYSKYVTKICKKYKFKPNDNQYAALTSYCFNCGPGSLDHLLDRCDYNPEDSNGALKIANELVQNINEPANIAKGILNRRADERALFMQPIQ